MTRVCLICNSKVTSRRLTVRFLRRTISCVAVWLVGDRTHAASYIVVPPSPISANEINAAYTAVPRERRIDSARFQQTAPETCSAQHTSANVTPSCGPAGTPE